MVKKVSFCVKEQINAHTTIDYILKNFDFIVDDNNPDYVFCLGGDGTFLDAVNRFGTSVTYVPINLGSLGFYYSWDEVDLAALKIDIECNNILKAVMLEVQLCSENVCKKYYSLNETTIVNNLNTQILEIGINNSHLEHFRGTGICISTPTGSTAYNKSLGGAIISSSKRLYQLTHIATINNVKYRSVENSIILDDTEELTFRGDFVNSIVSIDRDTHALKDFDEVRVKLSDKYISILVPEKNNFYERLRKAFVG